MQSDVSPPATTAVAGAAGTAVFAAAFGASAAVQVSHDGQGQDDDYGKQYV